MGLDITYYRELYTVDPKFVRMEDDLPVDYALYFVPVHMPASEAHWPGRAVPVELDRIYRFSERGTFRAGSYGGYNEWRRWLATVAPLPAFAELIEFSDCEGVIGSVVSAKLAKDFSDNEAAAIVAAKDIQDWFLNQYRRWWRAFDTASVGGAVEFH